MMATGLLVIIGHHVWSIAVVMVVIVYWCIAVIIVVQFLSCHLMAIVVQLFHLSSMAINSLQLYFTIAITRWQLMAIVLSYCNIIIITTKPQYAASTQSRHFAGFPTAHSSTSNI